MGSRDELYSILKKNQSVEAQTQQQQQQSQNQQQQQTQKDQQQQLTSETEASRAVQGSVLCPLIDADDCVGKKTS